MVYSIIFFALAAICNAVMDVLTHHWDDCIFKQLKRSRYWNPSISWKNKYIDNDPGKPIKKICFGLFDKPFTDAWHLFKSLMVVFLALSAAFSFNQLALFVILGIAWNCIFNIFYNHILVK